MHQKGFSFVIVLFALALVGGAVAVENLHPLSFSPSVEGERLTAATSVAAKRDATAAYQKQLADIEREVGFAQKSGGISPASYRDIDRKLKSLEKKGLNTKKTRGLLKKLTVGGQTREAKTTEAVTKETAGNEPPVKLKGIGINLDYYDPTTGKAGDVVFTQNKLQFSVPFTEFGFTIPANMSSSGSSKRNPQPTFQLPMGTKVHSLIDGVVIEIPTLYSGDVSIMVGPSANSNWRYETEHVINPLVKVGEKVVAGQIIAEVSPHNKEGNSGFGLVEIGILKGGSSPQHLCPFAYLDPSIKDDVFKKLRALYKSWEEYRGNTALYNEAEQATAPGCLTLDPING